MSFILALKLRGSMGQESTDPSTRERHLALRYMSSLHHIYQEMIPNQVPIVVPLSTLLCCTQSPISFQISSFSLIFIPAANALVVVATKILAPSHPSSSSPSPAFTTPILSSCHPYRNSSFPNFLFLFTLKILSHILLPTMHTASGLYLAIFSSNTLTPSSSSEFLSSEPLREGRETMLVLPKEYRDGRREVCEGGSLDGAGVRLDVQRRCQK